MSEQYWLKYRKTTGADEAAKKDAAALIEKLRQRRAPAPAPAGTKTRDQAKEPLRPQCK